LVLPAAYVTPAAFVLTIGGLLSCFAGYRLFRFVLGLYGFILGAALVSSMSNPHTTWALIVEGMVGGLVGAILMIAAYFVGVGLVGAGLAALALTSGWHFFVHTDPPTLILVIVSVVGALCALSIVRYVVVFGTALAGSWTLIVGGLALSGDAAAKRAATAGDVWILYPLDPLQGRWWVLGLWFVVAFAGVIAQLATTRKKQGQRVKRRMPQETP
jgi:hypothetical protein